MNTQHETPRPKGTSASASGTFTGTLIGDQLTWSLTFGGLTGGATASHVHSGAAGRSGSVVLTLCGPCMSGASGTITLSAAQVKALASGSVYVNVHTARNPNGEIRGQIKRTS